jgi:hypothetical protein
VREGRRRSKRGKIYFSLVSNCRQKHVDKKIKKSELKKRSGFLKSFEDL